MIDGHVRLLPAHVANKIAAGEVVERPASALKELMENSIDAGASRIDVFIAAGGSKLISVRDNGCGMGRDDALMSLERQATSKIGDVDDIERIETLGFRGEAIPSIASVSRFTMTTRTSQAEGAVRLQVNAGRLAEVSQYGAPPGTQVDVRDLFCNVPARKKFLRSIPTEEAHIKAAFTAAALAHPDIGFSLNIDGRELYRLHGGDTLPDRVRSLFGAEWTDGLLAVDYEQGDVRVHGFVEFPRMGSAMRHEQHVFVNGRPASAPPISYALRETMPRKDSSSRAGCVLFIDLPAKDVDVNVHPAKREVRFRHSAAIREILMAAIAGAARHGEPAAAGTVAAGQPDAVGNAPVSLEAGETIGFSASPSFALAPDPYTPEFDLHAPPPPRPVPAPPPDQPEPEGAERPFETVAPLWKTCDVIGSLSSGYLILETDSGLVTLNPQAACERIAYDRMMAAAQKSPSQNLLIPEVVTLPPASSARLEMFKDVFEAMGFSIENMGGDVWKIDSVPAILGETPPAGILPSILSDMAESGAKRGGERWREEKVSRAVATAYAKFSHRTTPGSARKLVEELSACQMPYVSPRGKPTMIFTSNRELDRRFGL